MQNSMNNRLHTQNSLRSTEEIHDCIETKIQISEKKIIGNEKNNSKSKMIMGIAVGIVLLMIMGFGWYSTTRVKIPKVIGLNQKEATRTLKESNLIPKVNYKEVKNEVAEPSVIDQDIDAGNKIKKGSTIIITIEKEANYTILDDFTNKKFDSVINELGEKNITVTKTEKFHDHIKKGKIIGQDIKKGKKVYEGESVEFVVSKGHEKTKVPNVAGKSQDVAKNTLEKAKLSVNTDYEYSESVSKGNVMRQSIAEDTTVDTKTEITVVISKGKQSTSSKERPVKSTKANLAAVRISYMKSPKKGIFEMKWSPSPNVTGYQVYFSSSKGFDHDTYAKTFSKGTVKVRGPKLESDKVYYGKVRSYVKKGNKTHYGAWSAVKSVRIK